MNYLYHAVPKKMDDTILYPLNVLKTSHPELYLQYAKKYEGREMLLGTVIPGLNCLWNDVIHMTAVSPENIKKNFAKAGIEYPFKLRYFKIPTSLVDGPHSVAFTYTDPISNLSLKKYEAFDSGQMNKYAEVPPETIKYYEEMKALDKRPAVFHLVPHILYKGSI